MADVSWLTLLGFLFLTFNSGMAVYRSNGGDTGSIIFVVLSYVDLVALLMAASAVFCRVLLLVLNAFAIPLHRHLVPTLRLHRLHRRYDAAILNMVLGASSLFHAVIAAGPNDDIHALAAAGGFLIWLASVAELLLALTPGLF